MSASLHSVREDWSRDKHCTETIWLAMGVLSSIKSART